jgi:cold shock protein
LGSVATGLALDAARTCGRRNEPNAGKAFTPGLLQRPFVCHDVGFAQDRRCDVASGTVKWFNPTKGYGFIQPSGGGGKDVFVHISAVERAGLSTLNEGQQVDYEIVSNRGKESAENLKVK